MSGCSERWTAAVVFLALFVCVTSPLPAGPLPATGVLDALAEPDGSAVSLKAVSVQKTAADPPHIVVSDPWAGDHDASPTPSEPPAASYRRNKAVCQAPTTPVEIFWCIDATGSMGGDGGHSAHQSVARFVNELDEMGVLVRMGGVKFNDGQSGIPDTFDLAQYRVLGTYTNANVAAFTGSGWLGNGYWPNGGDEPELQLDALMLAATDMSANSTPGNSNRYIVLITDQEYHEAPDGVSSYTKSAVISALQSCGARVHISIWEPFGGSFWLDHYQGLNVQGVNEPNAYPAEIPANERFTMPVLRSRIVQDWP